MMKNDWVCVFSVGLYIRLHIVDSSCGYTVLWDYLSLGSDNHPPVSLLSSSFLLPCLTLFSWGWCLGEASKNSSGEKASSLQQHGDTCQLASLLGCPSSVSLITLNLITLNLITWNLITLDLAVPSCSLNLITWNLITLDLAVPSCSLFCLH